MKKIYLPIIALLFSAHFMFAETVNVNSALLVGLTGDAVVQQIATITGSNGLPANSDYNSPLNFTTNSFTAPEGQYILAIAENANGSDYWYYCSGQTYTNPVLIDGVNAGITSPVTEITTDPLKIYANPSSDKINIDAGEVRGNYTLAVFNSIGQQVSEGIGSLNGQKISLDVSSLPVGLYTIQLKAGSGMLNSKFMVK